MTDQNEEYLFNKYPKIFAQKDLSMYETAMCWGIDCGDGWLKIIDELCEKIQARCDEEGYTHVQATQVKEKWGGLRFYMNVADDYIYRLIDEAERASEITCEICGEPGKLYTDGWYTVRCEKCKEKEDNPKL